MAKVLKNNEFYKVGNSGFVEVTTIVQLDNGLDEATILRNAADAIKFYADNGVHKTWTKEISYRKA